MNEILIEPSDVVIVVPVWRRTSNLERLVTSIEATAGGAHILLVASDGDEKYQRFVAVADDLDVDIVSIAGRGGERGDYARKINEGYRRTSELTIFTGADDLVFHDGWFEAVGALIHPVSWLNDMVEHNPIGVVGTVDGCNGRTLSGMHSTHSLVARWYADVGATIDGDHEIYSESYWHEYCDDEMCEVAYTRGVYAHAYDALVEHMHPNVHKASPDEVYNHGRTYSRVSRRAFLYRRRLWAPPSS